MLEIAMEKKKGVEILRKQIKELEEDSGLNDMRTELVELEKDYADFLAKAVQEGVTSEGSLQVVDTSIKRRIIKYIAELREDMPEVFDRSVKVSVTEAEKTLIDLFVGGGMELKAVKDAAREKLEQYCVYDVKPKYEVIDIAG